MCQMIDMHLHGEPKVTDLPRADGTCWCPLNTPESPDHEAAVLELGRHLLTFLNRGSKEEAGCKQRVEVHVDLWRW